MNRRDFSKGVSAIIVGSQPAAHRLLATQSAALGVDHEAPAPWTLTGEDMRASLNDDGTIRVMEVKTGSAWEAVEFRHGPFAGPAWAGVKMQRHEGSAFSFVAKVDGIRYSLGYRIDGNRLAIVAGLKNEAQTEFA